MEAQRKAFSQLLLYWRLSLVRCCLLCAHLSLRMWVVIHPCGATVMAFAVTASVEFRAAASLAFQQTGVNFQYAFALREIAAVLSGVCVASASQFQRPALLVQLWLHETLRVYADRMSNERDCARMTQLATDHCKKSFDVDMNEPAAAVPVGSGTKAATALQLGSQLFTPFRLDHMGPGCGACSDSAWFPVTDLDSVRDALYQSLKVCVSLWICSASCLIDFHRFAQQYNETEAVMNLVLFDRAVEHLLRIARILCRPSSSMLFIGVGGSGKQSLVRLAAYVCGLQVRSPGVSSSYTVTEFKELLKGALILLLFASHSQEVHHAFPSPGSGQRLPPLPLVVFHCCV